MIITLFLTLITTVVNFILTLGFLPTVSSLPFGLDSIIISMSGYYHGAMVSFPFLVVVWDCFLWLIRFEIALLVLKFILGSRLPVHPSVSINR